jgi:putative MATE family efflux protein
MKKNGFLKKVSLIAIPIAMQNLIISSINVADVFMIGKLGEIPLAALGLANQIMFIFTLMLFGINSGAGVMTAQFWGKKDIKNIHKVLGLALSLSIAIALLFFLGAKLIPYKLIRLYSPDAEVIRLGGNYLKIVCWSYIFTAISFVYALQLRNLSIIKISVYSSLITLMINITLNYILIFGNLGFRPMGVEGAAIATGIARFMEATFIISYVHIKKYPLVSKVKNLFGFNKNFVKRYFQISMPVILNEGFWALGITSYSMIYAHMSTSAIATINIVSSIERIIFTGFIGIANAAAVLVGNKVGEGNEVEAKIYGKHSSILAVLSGLAGSLIILIGARPVLNVYNLSPEVDMMAFKTLMVLCLILPFKAFNGTVVVGVLRGGGDTKYALFVDLFALWLMGVPMTFFAGLYFGLPIYFVYLVAGTEEMVKFFFGIHRLKSGKWVKNVVENL